MNANQVLEFMEENSLSVVNVEGKWYCFQLDESPETYFDYLSDTLDGHFRDTEIRGLGETILEAIAQAMNPELSSAVLKEMIRVEREKWIRDQRNR